MFDLLDPLVDLGITHIDITYRAEQIVSYVTQHGIVVPISQRKKPGTVGIAGTIRERYQVERYKDHKDNIRKVGIQWCLEQCAALRAGGAPSLHFYAARCAPIRELLTQL